MPESWGGMIKCSRMNVNGVCELAQQVVVKTCNLLVKQPWYILKNELTFNFVMIKCRQEELDPLLELAEGPELFLFV